MGPRLRGDDRNMGCATFHKPLSPCHRSWFRFAKCTNFGFVLPKQMMRFLPLVPAKAGTQGQTYGCLRDWAPASAGANGDIASSSLRTRDHGTGRPQSNCASSKINSYFSHGEAPRAETRPAHPAGAQWPIEIPQCGKSQLIGLLISERGNPSLDSLDMNCNRSRDVVRHGSAIGLTELRNCLVNVDPWRCRQAGFGLINVVAPASTT
jgi:hypothetical protein